MARQSAGKAASAEFAAEPGVDKMGLKFVSLPPGRVIVKQAEAGMWAAEQGILAGAELAAINGQRVAEMSRDEFVSAMAGRPIRMEMALDPRALTSELTTTSSASDVLRVIAPWVDGSYFNVIHMTTAIYRLGFLSEDFSEQTADSPIFRTLIEIIQGSWSRFDGRQIANMLWAIAKLRPHVQCFKELLPGLTERSAAVADTMDAQAVANAFWSAAVLKKEVPSLRNLPPGLFKAAHKQAPRMKPQEISNIIWALAVLRPSSEEVRGLLGTMSREAAEKIGGFKPQELANTCYGMAQLEVQDHTLMTLIADEALKKVTRWSKKDLSYNLPAIIWAHARVGLNSSELLEMAAQLLPSVIRRLPDWDLCALVWSYVKLDPDKAHADFRKQLRAEVTRRSLDTQAVKRARLGLEEWMAE